MAAMLAMAMLPGVRNSGCIGRVCDESVMEAWVRKVLCVERPDLSGGMYVSEYGDGVFPREAADPACAGCGPRGVLYKG